MKIIAANWKLQKNPKEARDFFSALKDKLELSSEKKMLVFPSSTCFESVAQAVQGTNIEWGSQNCFSEAKGAFTGEISAQVVKEIGGHWILLGHSERRKIFNESDELISQKLKLVQSLSLKPMLCIGETLEERKAGSTQEVIRHQLKKGLSLANPKLELAVAYEPVWAIGTGQVASVAQVKEAHLWVREILLGLGFSKTLPILYGGSVKPDNSSELSQIPNVDGFLIGGASLEPQSFLEIYQRA